MSKTPHKVTTEIIVEGMADSWQLRASSTTADENRRKRLEVAVGRPAFRVRYHDFNTNEHVNVYQGASLDEAVSHYNRLR